MPFPLALLAVAIPVKLAVGYKLYKNMTRDDTVRAAADTDESNPDIPASK